MESAIATEFVRRFDNAFAEEDIEISVRSDNVTRGAEYIRVTITFGEGVSLNEVNNSETNFNLEAEPFEIYVNSVLYTSGRVTTIPPTIIDNSTDDGLDADVRLVLFICLVVVLALIIVGIVVIRARSARRPPSDQDLNLPVKDGIMINRMEKPIYLDPADTEAIPGHYYPQ